MRRIFLTSLLIMTVMGGFPTTGESTDTEIRKIPITRVLRIPLSPITPEATTAGSAADLPGLMASPGGEDETPEGPNSFDVFNDGSFLVTDPILGRLTQFDAKGGFKRSWHLGFAADRVRVLPDETVEVRAARTSAVYVLDAKGELHPSEAKTLNYSAKITSPQTGLVVRGAGNAGSSSPINVQLDQPGFTLLSLELIGAGEDGSAYVALEDTRSEKGDEGISVNKSVRRYSAAGKLLSRTEDIPLDYYITPVDELRVRKGVVYQLMTTPSEVHVNVWNMN